VLNEEDVLERQKGTIEGIADKVWKFFASVKLAVVLLIILALVSIIGTVIQQNEPPERYLQEYSQSTVRFFNMLGLFDMYHTWWFVLLLILLTANLAVCTLERFPHTWDIVKSPLRPLDDEAEKALPYRTELHLQEGRVHARERVIQALTSLRYPVTELQDTESTQFLSQKGVYSRMGVYITHFSIILIFIGALTGVFFGFKAFLSLPEGAAQKIVYLRNEPLWDRILSSFGIAESCVQWDPEAELPTMPLGFFVQCDEFDVDYYVNASGIPTGMPSEYHSTLSIFDLSGKIILSKRITVNDPLTYNGITFYQSSYGTMPNTPGKIVLNIRQKNSTAGEQVVVNLGGSQYVSSIDRTVTVLGFAPFGIRDSTTGQVMLFRAEHGEYINPAVQLQVSKGKKTLYTTEILKADRGKPYMPEDYTITLVRYAGTRYTGLQVTKDPGVWIVYTGFVLLCIGPLIAFFGSHKKLWITIQERNGQSIIRISGTANKNRAGFEREFKKIADAISK